MMKRMLVCCVFYLSLVSACAPSESTIGTAIAQTLDAQTRVAASAIPFETPIPSDSPTPLPSKTPTSRPSDTPTLIVTYIATHVVQFPGFTVYWKRELWERAIDAETLIEDFENDEADYGELSYPFLTGNGFLLEGESAAQIISGGNLLPTGNVLHFRDWATGLRFLFPNSTSVRAFGFDFKPTEDWQLHFNLFHVLIPGGRRGFIGIVIEEEYPNEFVLLSTERVQGGLTVDNISYLPVDAP
jgi:hypothetical protein